MRYGMRLALALGFVGAVAMTAVAFGTTESDDGTSPAPTADAERRMDRREAKRHWLREHRRHPKRAFRRLVHSESKIQLPDGTFGRLIIDHGTITDLDHGAKTLTLERADNETVTVTASDDTAIRRNRDQAPFDALKEGDIVRVVQIDKGEGLTVKLIAAHEPKAENKTSTSEEAPASDTASPALFDLSA